MSNFSQIDFYIPVTRDRFDASAEPVIEDAVALDSVNRTIADGGQVADIVDGDPNGRLQPGTDLITGDDSTFASDTGNWVRDSGVTIESGKLTFTAVAAGDGASITVPFGFGTFATSFITTGLSAGVETLRIEVGDAVGTTINTNDTQTEDLTPTSGTTIRFEVVDGPCTGTVDLTTVRLKDKFRYDIQLDRRVDVDAMAIVNHNMRDVLPTDERESVKLYWDTDDVFAGSTEIVPTSIIAHKYRAETQTFLDFDGVDDKVDCGTGIPDLELGSTISMWVQANSLSPALRTTALANSDADGIECGIQLSSSGDIICKFETPSLFGASGPLPDTDWHLVTLTFSGSALLLYIDGVVQSGTTQGVTAATDKLMIGARTDLSAGQFWNGGIKDVQILNRVIDAAEALDRFNNPQDYPLAADQWPEQIVSGWTNQGFATFTSSGVDITQAVSDAVSDLCYSAIVTEDGIEHLVSFFITVNAGTVADLRFRVTSNILSADQTVNHTVTAGQNTIRYTSEATDAFCGFVDIAGSTPKIDFAVSEFSFAQEGNVAAYQSEGIATTQSTWFERVASKDGTITGAEGRNNPGNSMLFMQFDSINAKYWFTETNPDALTFIGAYKVGQVELLERFRPSTNPDVTGVAETLDQSGLDESPKYGGGFDINERHDLNTPIDVAYSFFLEADRAKFKELLRQGKKRVIPYTLNGDAAEPIIKFGRILGNPKIPAVAFGAYTIQFQIGEEV